MAVQFDVREGSTSSGGLYGDSAAHSEGECTVCEGSCRFGRLGARETEIAGAVAEARQDAVASTVVVEFHGRSLFCATMLCFLLFVLSMGFCLGVALVRYGRGGGNAPDPQFRVMRDA